MLTRRAFGGALFGAAFLPSPLVAAGVRTVSIRGFVFEPDGLTIRAGDTVTWVNQDIAPHTATGADWDTGELVRGQSETIRFATPGRYPYICAYHPHMTGEIVVE